MLLYVIWCEYRMNKESFVPMESFRYLTGYFSMRCYQNYMSTNRSPLLGVRKITPPKSALMISLNKTRFTIQYKHHSHTTPNQLWWYLSTNLGLQFSINTTNTQPQISSDDSFKQTRFTIQYKHHSYTTTTSPLDHPYTNSRLPLHHPHTPPLYHPYTTPTPRLQYPNTAPKPPNTTATPP